MEDHPVGNTNKPKELILACKYSCGRLFARKFDKQNHEMIAHPDKENLKIKLLVFSTDGIIDEENAPTVAASEEAGGKFDHSETGRKSSEA